MGQLNRGRLSLALKGAYLLCILMIFLSTPPRPVRAESLSGLEAAVYIRADGSIYPADAPVTTYDKVTYVLTGDIKSSKHGIVVERDNIVIDGNGHNIVGPGDGAGIYLSGRKGVTIRNVNIRGFRQGIYAERLVNGQISGNRIEGNDLGIELIISSYNEIYKNEIKDCSYGIALDDSSYNEIYENEIKDCSYGIYLKDSSNSKVVGNTFINTGLFVIDSYQNTVKDNTVNGKPLVYLEGVSDYVVKEAGQVILVRCRNIRVENLNLSRTTVGVELWETNNSIISRNRIEGNKLGIRLGYSSYNKIYENEIKDCSYGIYLGDSSNNTIFHNDFINNNIQVDGINSLNLWDDGRSGNYWSDYEGPDENRDGIGDKPYIIDGRNRDNYPLMKPFTGSLPQPSPQPPPQGTLPPTLYAAILTAVFCTAIAVLALYRWGKVASRGASVRERRTVVKGGEGGARLTKVGETEVVDPSRIKEYLERLEEPVKPAEKPVAAPLQVLEVSAPALRAGSWGRLRVRVRGRGRVFVEVEGDVDYLAAGEVVEGEGIVEVAVKPKTAGEVPVKVVVKGEGSEESKLTWLKVEAGACPSCGAPIEPGAKYCWRCGAKLE
jgi:parallel beta-helix repeat protein